MLSLVMYTTTTILWPFGSGSKAEMSTLLKYRKSGNFHVKIIHVFNIHVDLFSWVYGTHENILT